MLNSHPPGSAPAAAAIWLDLLSPTDAERAQAEAAAGFVLPSREALSEIETSSRIRVRGGVLYMSVPSAAPQPGGARSGAPIGFVLSRDRLVTVRYTPLPSFDAVAESFGTPEHAPTEALEVFVALCEEIVDRIADGLEGLAEEIGAMSVAAFHVDNPEGRRAVRSNRILRDQLRGLGRTGDRLSEMRETLLALARVVSFAVHHTEGWTEDATVIARLNSQIQDIGSLNDFEESLSSKVQFLLDALVGLISIAQNDIFKVLTIVSIVGIPPTLVASLYGMNFHNMPELSWRYGYQYGLAMIVVSTVIPLVWFKIRGWF
jgi:magnesium transporter